MKKFRYIALVTVVLITLLGIVWLSTNRVSEPRMFADQNDNRNPISPQETAIQLDGLETNLNGNVDNTEIVKISDDQPPTPPVEKLDYSEDWCQYRQLSDKDQRFAEAELSDWKASVGRYGFHIRTEYGYQDDGSGDVLQPYLEISKDVLRAYIDNGNPLAMLGAITRADFRLEEQDDIAKELLVLGYTGNAIQYLVIRETLTAAKFYQTDGVLSKRVKTALQQALVYATFGLENYDAIGVLQLVYYSDVFQDLYSSGPEKRFELSASDLGEVTIKTEQLTQWVNKQRFARGLPDLLREPSKIAKHELDRDIGTLYGLRPEIMNALNEYLGSEFTHLSPNECNEVHREMFARIKKHINQSSK